MANRVRIVAIVVAVAALGAAATGCSPPPSASPTTSTGATTGTPEPATSATTTPSASPTTDPGVPAEARVDTIDGAEAFVKYFIQQLNRSWTEPNSALMGPLCLPKSLTCEEYVSKAREYEAKGWRYVGLPYNVSPTYALTWSAGVATVLAKGGQPEGKVTDSSGSIVHVTKPSPIGLVFHVEYHDQWRVAEIQAEATPT